MSTKQKLTEDIIPPKNNYKVTHSVEFFHIYTDETINGRHVKGLEYLKKFASTWEFNYNRIILIDDYNPTEQKTSLEEILNFLDKKGLFPDYWAYESAMVENVQQLLDSLTNDKLKRSYVNYIDKHKKYPCSLLTAVWYLTRLGYFKSEGIIFSTHNVSAKYQPSPYLLNLLPRDFRPTEERVFKLLRKSDYSSTVDLIQDMFYPVDSGKAKDLF